MFQIQEELKKVPELPGVYIMHDASGKVLYVGKARILKNRLRSYFQKSAHSQRITQMIAQISYFEYIVASNEYEALVLECNLIKKYKPKYNVLLKDDKGYPYIKVTRGELYPRIMMVRKVEKDGAKYFGPYYSAWTVNTTLEALRKVFPLRPCTKEITAGRLADRPCLNYHIGLCRGACCGKITPEEYRELADELCAFLAGRQAEVMERIRGKMLEAADRLEFERAAVYREQLKALSRIHMKQKVASLSEEDFDVAALSHDDVDACLQVFFVRGGRVTGRDYYIFEGVGNEDEGEIMAAFIKQFYRDHQFIPARIYVPCELSSGEHDDDSETQIAADCAGPEIAAEDTVPERKTEDAAPEIAAESTAAETVTAAAAEESVQAGAAADGAFTDSQLIAGWLSQRSGRRVELIVPKRGDKFQLIQMAKQNAEITLKNMKQASQTGSAGKADLRILERLAEVLQLAQIPYRIEAYDISNTGDSDINASMVVFINGAACKREYKLYQMKSVLSRNDVGSMKEVLERRFRRLLSGDVHFNKMPDLLLVDGGMGQVNAAREVLEELQLEVPVFGMVKDNRHKTKAITGSCGEILLKQDLELWRFISSIQNEAHRFAVEYNRKLTEKRYRKSILDEIPGVGKKRKMALFRHFGSLAAVKKATLEELKAVKGMNAQAAENVYQRLQEAAAKEAGGANRTEA